MFKELFKDSFVKAFSYNSIVVIGKLVSSFVVSKVSAVFLGPAGYAIVGNFKNVLQGVLIISVGGFQSGTIKYIAENKNNPKQLKIVISSAFFLSVAISLFLGVLLVVFSNSLSIYILKDSSLAYIFRYLGIALPLMSLNLLFIYILNGLQNFKLYTILISVGNGLNALLTFLFIYNFNLKGALIASIVVPAASLVSFFFFKSIRVLLKDAFENIRNISKTFLKSISTYLVMAIYSSILLSLCYLLIRNRIISNLDLETAGLWEAMNKISTFYMIFFSSLFTLYLLPKLAVNNTVSGYYEIMKTYFKFLIPVIIVLFIGLLIFRTLVIKIFLTDAFKSIEQFFYLQLIGDFIKVIAFSIAHQFHAKKMVVFYFISDFVLYVSFYLISTSLIDYYSLHGVFYAYIISVSLYLTSVVIFVLSNNSNYLEQNA